MKMKNVEDIYPLSPMQQGMLFHTLYDPTSGVYFEQLSCTLSGEFDVSAFKRAWEAVMARHAVLRTAFLWEGLEKPLQVVRQKVALPWQAHDWRGVTNQQEKLQTFLKEDRQRGFELAKAPLMRCTLIQLDEQKYEFVWGFHHVLMDGWSFPLVMKEMFAFYEAFSQGQTLSLPHPRPYRTYIAWLQMQDMSNAEAYWRQTLKGFTAPTPLVVTKERAKASDRHEDVYVELSEGVTNRLQALAKTHHLTLNTMIQGAWALLLSRYSGEKEVLFGSTVSGRPTELVEAESIVGLFINTLPMRVAVSDELDLMTWLQQIQAQAVEQRQYEYTPLVEIQGWSEVPRGSALFDSILVFENYPEDESLQEEPAGTLEIEAVESFDQTNYPLTVTALPGREFSLRLSYDSGYFEADTMQRMGGHLQTLLEGMAATPQQRVKELSLLTERERQQILVEWNQTEADYPAQWCIHEWIESQVKQTPHAVAVAASTPMLGGKSELTYHELNARANQLAHYLRRLGVKAEVPVAICVECSVEMMIGLLAILKAGGAYVPLDPSYPKERLAFVLEDALGEVKVLLTQQKLLEDLPEMDRQTTVICVDTDVAASQSEENLVDVVEPDNLAYIIYTSGSTGKPKGVQVSHQNLVHSTHARVTYYEEPPTSFLMLSSFAFDASVAGIFWTLCTGGRLVLPPQDFQQEPDALAELIVQHQVSYLDAIPSFYTLILTQTDLAKLASLRAVIVGSEACPTELVKHHYERLPNATLFNEYGPTEATVWSTVYKCRFPEERSQVPIGRAIANTKIYILDDHLQPVPLGVPGQLYIGGAGVTRGYLNRPKLTKERFIDNPFGEGKLYNSGDMARYLIDTQGADSGCIDFLGRADDQVKIRGFRIELGEIHAYLSQHANVREAVVMARQDNASSKRLVAYFVPTEGLAPTSSDLRRYMLERLPNYMVPSVFVPLDAMPLMPNGKINRRALPAPDMSRRNLEEPFVAPRTPTEETLADIFATVLQLKQVGIHDNFFELGGHSLLATQVNSRMRKIFQIDLPLRDLFEEPTVAQLAERVETIRWASQMPEETDEDREEGEL